jgi:hypothetical protein
MGSNFSGDRSETVRDAALASTPADHRTQRPPEGGDRVVELDREDRPVAANMVVPGLLSTRG